MKNKNKIIGMSVVLISVGIYMVYKYLKNKPSKSAIEKQTENAMDAVKNVSTTVINNTKQLGEASFPLKKGSIGSNVIILQNWLNNNYYASPSLVPDGNFGEKTASAVKYMQNNASLKQISDFLIDEAFLGNYKSGEVTRKFYDQFIVKK